MLTPDNQPIRRSIRLKDFNYSSSGAYYVTICAFDHQLVFGEVVDNGLVPTEWGKIAEAYWTKIRERWAPVELDEYVLMPNHLHGVLIFPGGTNAPTSLGNIVNWYKSSVTKAVLRLEGGEEAKVWQRNYYEHIVRDENDLLRIQEYIAANLYKWADDEYYPKVR